MEKCDEVALRMSGMNGLDHIVPLASVLIMEVISSRIKRVRLNFWQRLVHE